MEFCKLFLLTFLCINIKRFIPRDLRQYKLLLTGIRIYCIKFILLSDWSEKSIDHPIFKFITYRFILHNQCLKSHGFTITKIWTFAQDDILIYSQTNQELILNVIILIVQWE